MEVLMGKSSINGLFSMAMLNNQRVILYDTDTMMDKNKRENKDISYGDHT